MNSLFIGQLYSQQLADSFVNYCKRTFASCEIPSCFCHDFSSKEINDIKEELPVFRKHFRQAFFNLMLLFEF